MVEWMEALEDARSKGFKRRHCSLQFRGSCSAEPHACRFWKPFALASRLKDRRDLFQLKPSINRVWQLDDRIVLYVLSRMCYRYIRDRVTTPDTSAGIHAIFGKVGGPF